MTNVIAIAPFEAEYPIKKMGGGTSWYRCKVVGIAHEGNFDDGRFIVMTEGDEGQMYTSSVQSVRRVAE